MKRIMVIGCCGAGKSTFSKKLSSITNLELIHLDQHYWKPNWEESETEEWTKKVKQLSQKEEWIIDGNYSRTLDIRMERADTIIYLDYSTIKCLWRITKRIVQNFGESRPDMVSGCNERFDLDFYHYVAIFNLTRRKKLLYRINKFKSSKSIHIFQSDKDAEIFLNKVTMGE